MTGVYDAWLVALSVVVAIFASYVALDLASRVTAAGSSRAQLWWLLGGALSFGMGIWSMHFIGMLAFRLPIPMAYDLLVTFLSLVFAVCSSGFALHVVSGGSLGTRRLLGAGILMGLGIAAMHYTGMAAMEITPPIRYGVVLFSLSIAIAIAASTAALWIAFQLRTENTLAAVWKKAGSAFAMGAAIAGMHYTGMAAAHFAPDSVWVVDPGNISNDWLAGTIAGFTFLFLATTLLISVFDARLADRSARLAATLREANAELGRHAAELTRAQAALEISERRYRTLWEASSDAVMLLSDEGHIKYANPAAKEIFGHEPAALAGRSIEVLQPPRLRAAHRAGFERHLRTGERTLNWRSVETDGLHADGHEFPVEIAFSRLEFNGRTGFAGFIKDITERKRFEHLLAGQKQVLEVIASNATLPETLCAVTRMVEARMPGWHCSILLLDESGTHVQTAAAESLPAEYSEAINGLQIGPAAGSCGTAAYRRERVVVEDIATDPLWAPYRGLALRHGLRACWSQPVMSQAGRVLGLFAMYYHEPRAPASHDLDLIMTAATLAAIAIERKRTEEHVRQTNERFQFVARATNDAVWDWDFSANTVWWNEGLHELFGYRPQEVEPGPESWTKRIHPEDCERVTSGIHAVVDRTGASSWQDEYRFRRSDGTYAEVLDRGYVIRDANGKAVRMLGAMMDITERKQAEEKVRRLNRVHVMLSGINALIARCRNRGELCEEACRIAVDHGGFHVAWIGMLDHESLNVRAVAWAGADAESLAGMPATARSDLPEGNGVMGRAIRAATPMFDNDITLDKRRAGARRAIALERGYRSLIALPLVIEGRVDGHLSLYTKEKGFFTEDEVNVLAELAGDISFALDHIEKGEKLNYLAYYDALTGLPNRALFHERLSHQLHVAAQQKVKVALLVSDVKRFRLINESLGRQSGDSLLKVFAARLKKMWPDPDNLARISADHFSGIVFNINELSEIASILDRLTTEVVNPPFSIGGSELSIAATAGIAVFPDDGDDAERLYNNAEAALKQAKARGERYLFYQPAMNAVVAETLLLESKLRRALEREQFVLHYQPKVSLAGGRLSGLEALIRWNEPGTGLVPPGRFIHLLEETGMINEIGLWALRRALADHESWSRQGLNPPRVAVNVSAVQLARADFVAVVRKVIDEFPAGAGGLDLEITESLLMQDIEGTIAKLHALRRMGVNIAIDDFGTGYSSLGYLARLPVNALKIDRSFIVTMGGSADSMTIVSTIVSLAHSLSLQVIAEGVDSEEQRRLLQVLKCDEIQGYLLSPPLPAADVARMLSVDTERAKQA